MKPIKISRPISHIKKPIFVSGLRTHLGSDLGAINRELKHALYNLNSIDHIKTIEKFWHSRLVVDCGSNSGYDVATLNRTYKAKAIWIDLWYKNDHPNMTVIQGDVLQMSQLITPRDIVYSCMFLDLLDWHDKGRYYLEDFVKEAIKVLKPNGYIICGGDFNQRILEVLDQNFETLHYTQNFYLGKKGL